MSCCGSTGLFINNDTTVIARLVNSSTPDTPVIDASVGWAMTDDVGPQSGAMVWDGSYVPPKETGLSHLTGFYVGQIPNTVTITEWEAYDIVITGSGGALAGDYQSTITAQAQVRR